MIQKCQSEFAVLNPTVIVDKKGAKIFQIEHA